MNKVVIVGHGPSIIGMGKYIDSFQYVLRFPYLGKWQKQKDFGKKTSYYCASTFRAKHRLRNDIPDLGYFIWAKWPGRNIGKKLTKLIEKHGGKDVSKLIQKWQKRLPENAYPYFSHGTAAICVAAAKIKKDIIAVGCDMLKCGNADKKHYVGSQVYENRKKNKPHHSFDCEIKIINDMATHYGVRIDFK